MAWSWFEDSNLETPLCEMRVSEKLSIPNPETIPVHIFFATGANANALAAITGWGEFSAGSSDLF